MLKLNQFQLKKNILLIEEYPVQVEEMVNGVHRSKEDIERERQMKSFRIGKVIAEGSIDEETLSTLSSKGKQLTTLIGQDVMYTANGVEVLDVAIDNQTRVVTTKAEYLFCIIVDETITTA